MEVDSTAIDAIRAVCVVVAFFMVAIAFSVLNKPKPKERKEMVDGPYESITRPERETPVSALARRIKEATDLKDHIAKLEEIVNGNAAVLDQMARDYDKLKQERDALAEERHTALLALGEETGKKAEAVKAWQKEVDRNTELMKLNTKFQTTCIEQANKLHGYVHLFGDNKEESFDDLIHHLYSEDPRKDLINRLCNYLGIEMPKGLIPSVEIFETCLATIARLKDQEGAYMTSLCEALRLQPGHGYSYKGLIREVELLASWKKEPDAPVEAVILTDNVARAIETHIENYLDRALEKRKFPR